MNMIHELPRKTYSSPAAAEKAVRDLEKKASEVAGIRHLIAASALGDKFFPVFLLSAAQLHMAFLLASHGFMVVRL